MHEPSRDGSQTRGPPSSSRRSHLSTPERRENRRPRRNSESAIFDRGSFDPREERRRREHRKEWRYVWLNFDIDMVDIGTSLFADFESIKMNIKRLKFERENTDEYWFNTEKYLLEDFKNVEEIHVVCADGFEQWAFAVYYHPWPCAVDNIVFFDPLDGQVARGMELERICRQILLDTRRELTGVAFHSSDESDS